MSSSIQLVDFGVGLLSEIFSECGVVDEVLDFVGFDFGRDWEFALDKLEEVEDLFPDAFGDGGDFNLHEWYEYMFLFIDGFGLLEELHGILLVISEFV